MISIFLTKIKILFLIVNMPSIIDIPIKQKCQKIKIFTFDAIGDLISRGQKPL